VNLYWKYYTRHNWKKNNIMFHLSSIMDIIYFCVNFTIVGVKWNERQCTTAIEVYKLWLLFTIIESWSIIMILWNIWNNSAVAHFTQQINKLKSHRFLGDH
jgi:hypothetical protein